MVTSTLVLPAPILGAVQGSELLAEPTCGACSVELVPVVTLGAVEDPAGVGLTAEVARSRAGLYAVSSYTSPGEIIIYDRSGRFRQLVGRQGEGPGEFASELELAFDAADSLHVIALGGTRHSVFTPELEHARSHTLPGALRDLCVGSDGTVFMVTVTLIDSTVWPAHIYSRGGEELAAMGAIPLEDANPDKAYRHAACGEEEYWGAAEAAYLVVRWRPDGQDQLDLRGTREWFPPPRVHKAGSGRNGPVRAVPMRGRATPFPKISGISLDGRGHLIVFLSIPDEDDQVAGVGPSGRAHAVVEFIDLSTRELLARKRFDQPLSPIKGGGAFSIVEHAVGNLRITVWDLVLSTP